MRPLVPPHIETLSPYVPGKPIEETERQYGITGVIKLASNENPLGPSPLAMAAMQKALPHLHLYPDGSGYLLKHKLAESFGVAPEEIFLGNGSNEIIELLIRTFLSGEDEALISAGSFVIYKLALQSHARRYQEVPMKNRAYDLEAFAARLSQRTRLIFLANPDNPTGTWFGKAPFDKFLKEVEHKAPEALVVMDEAYVEYVTTRDFPDGAEYRKGRPNVLSLRTFSKAYGLAGVRIGYGLMDRTIADYLNRTRMPFNVSTLGLIAGAAALDDKAHVAAARDNNAAGLALLTTELPRLGVDVLPSQANFVFADTHRPSAEVFEALLRKGVITRPIPSYGFPTALRITIGTPRENQKLLAALREVLK